METIAEGFIVLKRCTIVSILENGEVQFELCGHDLLDHFI